MKTCMHASENNKEDIGVLASRLDTGKISQELYALFHQAHSYLIFICTFN